MKVQVDDTLCIGCAMCVSMCETVFSMNEDGVCETIINEIPHEILIDVEEARDCCPVEAITMED